MKVNETKDGGPAFGGAYDVALIDPEGGQPPQKLEHRVRGMSLRDYFAAAALHGYMAGGMVPEGSDLSKPGVVSPGTVASRAYQYADAMLAARSK